MKLTFNLPTGWHDITLSKFFQIKEVQESDINDLEKEIKILSLITGNDEKDFNQLTLQTIKEIYRGLVWLNTEPVGDIKDYYHIGDRKYKLIKEIKDINAGQFIDLAHYTKDENLILDNTHMILSVLLLPVKPLNRNNRILNKVYKVVTKNKNIKDQADKRGWIYQEGEPEKYLETPLHLTAENIYENIAVTDALGITNFFFILSKVFAEATQTYLGNQVNSQLQSVLKILPENQKKIQKQIQEVLTGFTKNGSGLLQ